VKNGVMTFNGVQTIDFMSVPQLKGTFEGTICDEIIPLVYDDFSLTVDGPYLDKNLGVDLQEGEYVVDAGANLGLFACYAAHHGCHVYACDPDIQCVSALEKQRELYPDRIEVIPLGLSDREGEEKFYESEGCSLSSIYMPRGNTVEKTIKINTIDNLVANGIFEKVDYIKADIEGAERYMLMGAVETMRIQAPKLSICTYHYKDDPVVLENIIKNANPDYVISHNWRKLYAYVPK
jgi:FkbM family methyltransferase